MKFVDSFRRAGRSLRNAKGRTILTSLAIAVGAFTLTAAMAVGEGARQYTESLIGDNIHPQTLFIVADESLFTGGVQEQGLREYNPSLGEFSGMTLELMSQDQIDELNERDDIEKITPVYDLSMQYMEFEGSDKKYISSLSFFDSTVNSKALAGSLPENGQGLEVDEVVIPESFAKTLIEEGVAKDNEDLIGTAIKLRTPSNAASLAEAESRSTVVPDGQSFSVDPTAPASSRTVDLKISAITGQAMSAMSGTDALLVSDEQAREITEAATYGTPAYQNYMGVSALAVEGEDPAEVKQRLEDAGYTAQTAEDLQSLLFTIVNIMQVIVGGFGVLALIASVFGIINTQYISVLERTQQIGLMKALGMRGRYVSRLFQLEAAWIGLLGGVIGAALAIVVGTLVNPTISESIGLGEASLLIFQPIPIVILVAILILIAMLAGYFPAKKASKLDPIEALRTE